MNEPDAPAVAPEPVVSNIQALWSELQRCAGLHAEQLAKSSNNWVPMPLGPDARGRQPSWYAQSRCESKIIVNEEHRETVRILGRADAEEMCNRIHWYKFVMNIGLRTAEKGGK